MTDATVAGMRARIAALFANDLHLEVPDAGTNLFDAGVLDSLSFVTLLAALERELGVQVPIEDLELEHFSSIDAIARFVAARRSGVADAVRG